MRNPTLITKPRDAVKAGITRTAIPRVGWVSGLTGGFHFCSALTLGQVVERAVFGAAGMAMALGFAASAKTFDDRGAEKIGWNHQLLAEPSFPLTENHRGFLLWTVDPR